MAAKQGASGRSCRTTSGWANENISGERSIRRSCDQISAGHSIQQLFSCGHRARNRKYFCVMRWLDNAAATGNGPVRMLGWSCCIHTMAFRASLEVRQTRAGYFPLRANAFLITIWEMKGTSIGLIETADHTPFHIYSHQFAWAKTATSPTNVVNPRCFKRSLSARSDSPSKWELAASRANCVSIIFAAGATSQWLRSRTPLERRQRTLCVRVRARTTMELKVLQKNSPDLVSNSEI